MESKDINRFALKVEKQALGCWLWRGRTRNGYGRFDVGGKQVQAHRVAYELWLRPIPSGLHLDHLCRNRACCNPGHLEPVTQRENLHRGKPIHVTHCPQGHAYDKKNTRVRYRARLLKTGTITNTRERDCRICHRQSAARARVEAMQAAHGRTADESEAARGGP